MSASTNFSSKIVEMSSMLRPFALNLTRNVEDSEDLIQDTVVRALTNEDKFTEGTNLKAWLFTIMKNIFINNYRRNAKRNTIIDTTDNLYYINSADAVTGNDAEVSFVMEHVNDAMQTINPDYSIPFLMHFEGFKYLEIADILDLPLGTVKSRIFFARKELKNHLKKVGIENSKI